MQRPDHPTLRRSVRAALAAAAALLCAAVPGRAEDPAIPLWAQEALRAVCTTMREGGPLDSDAVARMLKAMPDTSAILNHDRTVFAAAAMRDGMELQIVIRLPATPRQRSQISARHAARAGRPSRPAFFVQATPDCRTELARAVRYPLDGQAADALFHFTGDPLAMSEVEELNPPVPPGGDPGGVAVAHVDTGVNYLLPQIAARLARGPDGALLGADLAEHDGRPFDLDPVRGPLFPRRHGTVVASLLLAEAARARLVPFRYPGEDAQGFADLVEAIAQSPARIVAMPLGGYRKADWQPFAAAAARHLELLFIISAGNEGRDIGLDPVYPAAFANENFLIVTSVDAFGRLPADSNWSAQHVDLAVPAERVAVIDHRGARASASGASYAVPRVAALAARFAAAHPDWDAARLKREILARAVPLPRAAAALTRHGWIANPALVPVE